MIISNVIGDERNALISKEYTTSKEACFCLSNSLPLSKIVNNSRDGITL